MIETRIKSIIEAAILQIYPEWSAETPKGVRGKNFLLVYTERTVDLDYTDDQDLNSTDNLISAVIDATLGIVFLSNEPIDMEPILTWILKNPIITDPDTELPIARIKLPLTTTILDSATIDKEILNIRLKYQYPGEFVPAPPTLLNILKQ